jgi:hypothetical protein
VRLIMRHGGTFERQCRICLQNQSAPRGVPHQPGSSGAQRSAKCPKVKWSSRSVPSGTSSSERPQRQKGGLTAPSLHAPPVSGREQDTGTPLWSSTFRHRRRHPAPRSLGHCRSHRRADPVLRRRGCPVRTQTPLRPGNPRSVAAGDTILATAATATSTRPVPRRTARGPSTCGVASSLWPPGASLPSRTTALRTRPGPATGASHERTPDHR